MIRFFNIWAENREKPREVMLLRYEDLHRNPRGELLRTLGFLGVPEVADATLEAAVAAASFDRMHELEAEGLVESSRLEPGDAADPESFKTRRGEVGGFRDYLSVEQSEWLETRMREELDGWFGYPV